jgi:hypothetical protein
MGTPITEESVLLYNHSTKKPEYVPVAGVSGALKSGQYSSMGGNTTQGEGGAVTRDASEAGISAIQGESQAPELAATRGLEARKQAQKDALDNSAAKALTFAEGATDAFTMGLLDAKDVAGIFGAGNNMDLQGLYEGAASTGGFAGDSAEARRSQLSGYHTAGTVAGVVGSLAIPGGPAGFVASKGIKGGQAVAKTLLGEQRVAAVLRAREASKALKTGATGMEGMLAAKDVASAGRAAGMGVRVAEEAGAGATLAGAMAFNSQLHDAIIEDKAFSGEAILHEVGMGTLMGAGVGALAGGAGALMKRASRKDVLAQSGLLDHTSDFSKGVHSDIRAGIQGFDEVLENHEMRVGMLDVLAKDGHIPTQFMGERRAIVKAARRAQERLSKIDMDAALSGTDNKAYLKWRDAMEEYQGHLVKLDDVMSPKFMERAMIDQAGSKAPLGRGPEPTPGPQATTEIRAAANGEVSPMSFGLDNAMEQGNKPLRMLEDSGGVHAGTGKKFPGGEIKDPLAAYERIYGRKYQPMEEVFAGSVTDDAGLAAAKAESKVVGESTNAGSPRSLKRGAPEAAPTTPVDDAVTQPGLITRSANPQAEANIVLNAPVGSEQHGYLFEQYTKQFKEMGLGPAKAPGGTGIAQGNPAPRGSTMEALDPHSRPMPADMQGRPGNETVPHFKHGDQSKTGIHEGSAARDARAMSDKQVGKDAVANYLKEWQNQSMQVGPKVTPADRAAAKLGRIMEQIRLSTGGALDSAAGASAMANMSLKPAATSFGAQIDQIIAARQLGLAAADASRGIKPRNGMLKWAGRYLSRKALAGAAGGVTGGPIGATLGYAFGDQLFGFAGKAAGAAGRLVQTTAKAVDGLLAGNRATMVGRAMASRDPAANVPVAYSDRGPIKDPVERILEVQRIASNPEAIRRQVLKGLGGAADLHPEIADAAVKLAQQRLIGLSMKAPAIYFDQLGNTVGPSTQAMRRWLESENALHNPDMVLEAVGNGTATEAQIDGLRQYHPGIHQRVIMQVMADPERLKALPRAQLKKVEAVLGIPLTRSSQPDFVARTIESWRVHTEQQLNTQALKPPAQTPAQAGAVAPGNQ